MVCGYLFPSIRAMRVMERIDVMSANELCSRNSEILQNSKQGVTCGLWLESININLI
jgi:hypothetical protein